MDHIYTQSINFKIQEIIYENTFSKFKDHIYTKSINFKIQGKYL